MVEFVGEKNLYLNTGRRKEAQINKLTHNVYVLQYFGSSNATLIIGDQGCILIDAFETDGYAEEAKQEIQKITDKPITNIVYTHTHADHIGGASAFSDTVQNVIGHVSNVPVIRRQNKIAADAQRRAVRQFGGALSAEEALSLGISPVFPSKGKVNPLPISQWLKEDITELVIEGVKLQFIAAPGEMDDEMAIWIPDQKVLCGGDNYYAAWPNLSALRGSTYRDVDQWVGSLGKYLDYPANYLVPGHGNVLAGHDTIAKVIGNYHDAIEWVLDATLDGINQGQTSEELVQNIQLPEKWAKLPYLQEYYGTVAWSVRGIFAGYVGWFDGNPTHIGSQSVSERAAKTITLMNGADNVAKAVEIALAKNDMQWAMELCDLLLDAGEYITQAKQWKAQACTYLGRMQTSANGRHYYLSCAKELRE